MVHGNYCHISWAKGRRSKCLINSLCPKGALGDTVRCTLCKTNNRYGTSTAIAFIPQHPSFCVLRCILSAVLRTCCLLPFQHGETAVIADPAHSWMQCLEPAGLGGTVIF